MARVIQRIRVAIHDIDVKLEAAQVARIGVSATVQGDTEGGWVERHKHFGAPAYNTRQPITSAEFHEYRVVRGSAVVKNKVIPLPRAFFPRTHSPACFV